MDQKKGRKLNDFELLSKTAEVLGKEVRCIIIQSSKHKIMWDLIIVVSLLFVCVVIPWRITFAQREDSDKLNNWDYFFYAIDGLFLIDMVMTFFTSITDEEKMIEITDNKLIAKNYFKFWFWIDFFSIFPFDLSSRLVAGIERNDGNALLRGLKLGKIGRLIRLMRLVKAFKIMKNSTNLSKKFSQKLALDAGTERLYFCFLLFFFMNHIFACLWVLLGQGLIATESSTMYDAEFAGKNKWE